MFIPLWLLIGIVLLVVFGDALVELISGLFALALFAVLLILPLAWLFNHC